MNEFFLLTRFSSHFDNYLSIFLPLFTRFCSKKKLGEKTFYSLDKNKVKQI